jgi:hypothetical protein
VKEDRMTTKAPHGLDLPLAYRIMSMQPVVPAVVVEPDCDRGALDDRLRAEASLIQHVPIFQLDNVAEFLALHEPRVWDPQEDIPNWAPPFETFFAEFRQPRFWNRGVEGIQAAEPDVPFQTGFLVYALDVTDENRSDLPLWKEVIERLSGAGFREGAGFDLAGALSGSRWLLGCSPWVAAGGEGGGIPAWTAYLQLLFVSPEGRLLQHARGGVGCRLTEAALGPAALLTFLLTLGLGISFSHCKNVRTVETPADRGGRWHRRTKAPVLTFRTLEINPMREVLRTEGRSGEEGLRRALHICRGHFATYGDDRPLFGKYAGTFWRPDHVRGRAEAGAVVKDYAVKAPQP